MASLVVRVPITTVSSAGSDAQNDLHGGEGLGVAVGRGIRALHLPTYADGECVLDRNEKIEHAWRDAGDLLVCFQRAHTSFDIRRHGYWIESDQGIHQQTSPKAIRSLRFGTSGGLRCAGMVECFNHLFGV